MALMDKNDFAGLADRMAYQYNTLKEALEAMSADGGGLFYERVSDTGDPDVEIPLVEPADAADSFLSGASAATDAYRYLRPLSDMVTAFEEHLAREGSLESPTWDGYCEDQDVRIPYSASQVVYAKKRRLMKARNVFKETATLMGSCEQISPSGILFDDGSSLGDGLATRLADGTYFAGAQLKAVVSGPTISSAISVRIIGLSELGEERQLDTDAIIVGPSGTAITIPPASGRFVDVTDVELLSGGSTGDKFDLFAIIEREPAL